jgi:hypothetical protein
VGAIFHANSKRRKRKSLLQAGDVVQFQHRELDRLLGAYPSHRLEKASPGMFPNDPKDLKTLWQVCQNTPGARLKGGALQWSKMGGNLPQPLLFRNLLTGQYFAGPDQLHDHDEGWGAGLPNGMSDPASGGAERASGATGPPPKLGTQASKWRNAAKRAVMTTRAVDNVVYNAGSDISNDAVSLVADSFAEERRLSDAKEQRGSKWEARSASLLADRLPGHDRPGGAEDQEPAGEETYGYAEDVAAFAAAPSGGGGAPNAELGAAATRYSQGVRSAVKVIAGSLNTGLTFDSSGERTCFGLVPVDGATAGSNGILNGSFCRLRDASNGYVHFPDDAAIASNAKANADSYVQKPRPQITSHSTYQDVFCITRVDKETIEDLYYVEGLSPILDELLQVVAPPESPPESPPDGDSDSVHSAVFPDSHYHPKGPPSSRGAGLLKLRQLLKVSKEDNNDRSQIMELGIALWVMLSLNLFCPLVVCCVLCAVCCVLCAVCCVLCVLGDGYFARTLCWRLLVWNDASLCLPHPA